MSMIRVSKNIGDERARPGRHDGGGQPEDQIFRHMRHQDAQRVAPSVFRITAS